MLLDPAGSATFPFFGVVPVLVDEKGNEVKGEGEGYLCIKQAWPSTLRTVYGDHDRYETNYFKPFPGYYFSGDGARRDKDGYIWITGRVDDVINVSGHRSAKGPQQLSLFEITKRHANALLSCYTQGGGGATQVRTLQGSTHLFV